MVMVIDYCLEFLRWARRAEARPVRCGRCGRQWETDEIGPYCFSCPKGRTAREVEQDVLVAMLLIEPFRQRASRVLRRDWFRLSTHRSLFAALAGVVPSEGQPEWLARTVGWSIPEAEEWILAASPWRYDADVALMAAHPGGLPDWPEAVFA